MIRGSAHSGDSAMLSFPAVIVGSKPSAAPHQDPPNEFLFPRIYEWRPSEGPQVIAAWWREAIVPGGCENVADPELSWATNFSESFYDPSLNNFPVPNGTPVMICYGLLPPPSRKPPLCNSFDPIPGLVCVPRYGVWFSHWVDPESIICNA